MKNSTKSIEEIIDEHRKEVKSRLMKKWEEFLDNIEQNYQRKLKEKNSK